MTARAIIVENLGKCFSRHHPERPQTIMEAALSGLRRLRPVETFWALRGISFSVAAGEMLGVIGHNGAGKSTLLHLLGKVAYPDEGGVKTQGRIGALLDLGAGFHGDLTGRENIFVAAAIAGMTRREIAQRFDQIVAFAELEPFIDNPVRTYSSGMTMRLAFATAIHAAPEILLVDEFLSVGDLSFQTKCLARVEAMKTEGCAIVLVSHDIAQVERLCDRVLWLQGGTAVACDRPAAVVGQYQVQMHQRTRELTPENLSSTAASGQTLEANKNRFGSLEVQITAVRLDPGFTVPSGAELCIELDYRRDCPAEYAIFSVSISGLDGSKLLSADTLQMGIPPVRLDDMGTVRLMLDRLDLSGGEYFIDVGLYKQDWSYAYDFHWHVYQLVVESPLTTEAVLQPPMRWTIALPGNTVP